MYNRITLAEGEKDKKPVLPPQDLLQKFGNWTGQTDTKVMAEDLIKRGLVGGEQLRYDQPNTSTAEGIRNAQSDWKVAAIQDILSNARKFNLRKPEEVLANKNVLISNPKWRDAINNDSFKTIHPNFWNVITDSLLPSQYAKEDAQRMVASNTPKRK